MKTFLNRLLDLHSDEWPRLLVIYVMFFIYVAAVNWGGTSAEAAFLSQFGVTSLPYAYIGGALLTIIAVAVYTAFADRIPNDMLLVGVCLTLAGGIGLSRILLLLGAAAPGYLLSFVLYRVSETVFVLHWWTYVNGFYDTRAAKRMVPIVMSSRIIAIFVAGVTLPTLNRIMGAPDIILMWGLLMLVVAVIAYQMAPILKEKRLIPSAAKGAQRSSFVKNASEGFSFVRASSYLRWLALSTFLALLIVGLVNYVSSQLLLQQFPNSKDLANFIGAVGGIASLVSFPFQLILISRLINRIGLGNSNMLYPGTSLLTALGLIFFPSVASGALGVINSRVFYFTFRGSVDRLLYNAVPLRVKGRARAFISGLLEPGGALVSGVFLLIVPFLHLPWLVSLVLGLAAVGYIVAGLSVRRYYREALLNMLDQENFSFMLAPGGDVSVNISDPATLEWLKKKIQDNPSRDLTVFMAQIAANIGGNEAETLLAQLARKSETSVKVAVLDILASAGARTDIVRTLYLEGIADSDPNVRRAAINGLDRLIDVGDSQIMTRVAELLKDPDVGVRAETIPVLAKSSNTALQTAARAALNQMLTDSNPQNKIYGVRLLSEIGDSQSIRALLEFLSDPDDTVRLQALTSIEVLSRTPIPQDIAALAVKRLADVQNDPVQGVRRAALLVLGRINLQESHQALIKALNDKSVEVKDTAVEALMKIGAPVVAALQSAKTSGDPQTRKMAAVALARIDKHAYGDLVKPEIDNNISAIYHNHSKLESLAPLSKKPSGTVLQSMFSDENRRLLDEFFYLLGTLHSPEVAQTVVDSFNGGTPRARANAAEALEALTSAHTAQLVAPLFDAPSPQLLTIAKDTFHAPQQDTSTLIKELIASPNDPWVRAMTAYALGEAEPTLSRQEIDALLATSLTDSVPEVQGAANAAKRMLNQSGNSTQKEARAMLSSVEKLVFLKQVSLFRGMTIEQLKVLVNICEEELFEQGKTIFNQGETGNTLYIVVNGRISLEEKAGDGKRQLLATVEPPSYFGDMSLFDNGPRSATATAAQDTLTLKLRREPLIKLAHQYPDLLMELVTVLSQRLRLADEEIARLAAAKV